MAIIKSDSTDLTINADGASSNLKLQIDGVEKASISSAGAFTSTTIDATALTGALPAIDGSSLTGVATDLTSIRNDIATLALHSAIADNKAAYNLPNSFIDQFQDDTGIGTETTGDRDVSEYWSTASSGAGNDVNTIFLIQPNTTNGSTTFTDIASGGAGGLTITGNGSIAHSTTQTKFGSSSIYLAGNQALSMPTHSSFDWGTGGAFTVDTWVYATSWTGFGQGDGKIWDGGGGHRFGFKSNGATIGGEQFTPAWTTHSMSNGTWYHIAWCRHTDGSCRAYIGGTQLTSTTGNTNNFDTADSILVLGDATGLSGSEDMSGVWVGGFRVSNIDRTKDSGDPMYISTGTSYTVPTDYYGASSLVAAGTLISTAQTANAAQTKVSGVILYKNNAGTATLGTDLKVYFTCNGGTNWTESTPVAAGTFSSGILMAKCPEVTCTSGTDIRYKAVWANQAVGTKETQLHGIGMNY